MRKIQNIFRMKKGKIRNQRGVALIFTLGILGLLTVMALGFASTAMLNQKIASNSAGASSARMLAQVGVQRALTAVALYTADAANNAVGFSDIFSREYGSGKTGNQNTCDFIWKLTTKINDIPLYELPVDYDNKSGVAWQYVTDPSDTTNNTLIGRYAYVVVPYYGALDPSVNYGQSFGTDSVTNPDNKLFTVYNIDMDKGISKGLTNAFTSLSSTIGGSGGNTPVITGNNSITTALTKAYNGRFYDLSEYVKRILYESSWAAKENANETNMIKRMKLFYYLKNIFAMNPYAYPEAYWIDCGKTSASDSNQSRSSANYLHRLSLDALADYWRSSASASTGNFSAIISGLTTPDNISSLSYSTSSKAPTVSDSTAIPWLAAWQGSNGTYWTNNVQKKQIAANLIQYSLDYDKPSVADVATNAFSEDTEPSLTYLGIGRHPYLNEIGIEAYVSGTLDPVNADTGEWRYTLKPYLGFGAELINMYTTEYENAMKPSNYRIYLYGTFSFAYKKTPDDSETECSVKDNVLLGSITPGAFSKGYTAMEVNCAGMDSVSDTLTIPTGTDTSKYLEITKMKLQVTKVVLAYNNGSGTDFTYIRDYAVPESSSDSWQAFGEKEVPNYYSQNSNKTWHYVKSYQTADPRVNHYPTDWTKGEKYSDTNSYANAAFSSSGIPKTTPGAVNEGVLSSYTGKFNGTDYDKETETDPACTTTTSRLSTAMIRHGKMLSLAEMGLIHRAAPFQTLNLKNARYITRNTELKFAGGNDYSEGDANILDQLKLTSDTAQYGKVNINSASHEALRALFNSMPYVQFSGLKPLPTTGEYDMFSAATFTTPLFVNEPGDAAVTGSRKACSSYNPTTSGNSCLACSIINRREVLLFKARSDLMLNLNDSTEFGKFSTGNSSFFLQPTLSEGASSQEAALKALSVSGQMTQGPKDVTAVNDWEQEQLIGHLADVITAEPPDLCIIAIGQTLKDIGGSKVYRNWGMSSIPSIKDDYYSSSDDTYRLYRKAGYIRPGQTNDYLENNQSSSVLGKGILKVADTPISKDKDVELGVYDVGFDKITGESKMIVWVRKDPVTQKWKVVRTMYAE